MGKILSNLDMSNLSADNQVQITDGAISMPIPVGIKRLVIHGKHITVDGSNEPNLHIFLNGDSEVDEVG